MFVLSRYKELKEHALEVCLETAVNGVRLSPGYTLCFFRGPERRGKPNRIKSYDAVRRRSCLACKHNMCSGISRQDLKAKPDPCSNGM